MPTGKGRFLETHFPLRWGRKEEEEEGRYTLEQFHVIGLCSTAKGEETIT